MDKKPSDRGDRFLVTGGYKYPRYAESDRGLNQSVAEAA